MVPTGPTVAFSAASDSINETAGTFSIPVTVTGTTYGTISSPAGLAFDAAGNLYVADGNFFDGVGKGTVMKVTPAGVVSTFAFVGVGGANDLAFDAAGNLYISNAGNKVSKVTPAGLVSTFASGFVNAQGLAFDVAGNLYVANAGNNTVSKVTSAGVVSPFASGFNAPDGLAFDDAGNLYVANDAGTVSKVTSAGVVSTFASGFNFPVGLAFDGAGNLYVANDAGTVSKVTPAGVVSSFASGLTNNGLDGLAFDAAGNLYLSDAGSVDKVTPAGVVSTFVPGFHFPDALAVDPGGNLYVASSTDNTVSKVTPTGLISTFASGFSSPRGLAIDGAGNLYVSNIQGNTVSKVTPTGVVSTFATGFANPFGLALDTAGNLYVSNTSYNYVGGVDAVSEVTPAGVVSRFANISPGMIPTALAFDAAGNLYVGGLPITASTPGSFPSIVDKVTSSGAVSIFASGFNTPEGLAFDAAGNLYVGDVSLGTVSEVTSSGVVSTFASGLNFPAGLAFDAAGNLYATDGGTVIKGSGPVSVPFTLGGTALSGIDYTGVSASPLVIPFGQSTGTITGTLINGGTPAATKTLTLTLGTPTSATLGAPSVNTLTIEAAPFTLTGTMLTVAGSSPSDNFTFVAGASEGMILNGATYGIDPAVIHTVQFVGVGGGTASFYDTGTGGDTATLAPGSGTMTGPGYSVSASGVNVVVANGGGSDTASLTGLASGNDFFSGNLVNDTSEIVAGNLIGAAVGFRTAIATSTTDNDAAYLYGDTASPSTFVANPSAAYVQNSAGILSEAVGFKINIGFSQSGNDTSNLSAGPGTNYLIDTATFSEIVEDKGGGAKVHNFAAGFKINYGSSTSPTDSAYLFDAPGTNTFVGTPAYAYMQEGTSGVLDEALGFPLVLGEHMPGGGGTDTAYLGDAAGAALASGVLFESYSTYSYMQGSFGGKAFDNFLLNFQSVQATSLTKDSTALLFDTLGGESFTGNAAQTSPSTPTSSYFVAGGVVVNLASGFHTVYAYAQPGSSDTADLFAHGNGTFTTLSGNDFELSGTGFAIITQGFGTGKVTRHL